MTRKRSFRYKAQGTRCKEGAFTLIELLIAATLGFVVILAIGQIDVTRIYLSQQVSPGDDVNLAMVHIGKQLEGADRIVLVSTGVAGLAPDNGFANVLMRVPIGTAFDIAGNYGWFQYLHTGTTVEFRPNCGGPAMIFNNIDHFNAQFIDEAQAPPSGAANEPFAGEDNNLLRFEMATLAPAPGIPVYVSQTTIRAGGYTDVNASSAARWDSGAGLAPLGTSDPPC